MKIYFYIINIVTAINWLGIVNEDEICWSSLLSPPQKRLCARGGVDPVALAHAARVTIDSCQDAMKENKWGCHISRHNTHSKEHAFIQALATAHLIVSVERVCQTGEERCHKPAGSYARQMIGLEKIESKVEQSIKRHNIQVGIEKLRQATQQKCRCHGQSGACSLKTCWSESPQPEVIAQELKKEYEQAVQVATDQNEATPMKKIPLELALLTPFFTERLLFTRTQRDFCSTTKGRSCQLNGDLTSESHCRNMCCGRGHLSKSFDTVEPGKCSFEWPSTIKCEQSRTVRRHINLCL